MNLEGVGVWGDQTSPARLPAGLPAYFTLTQYGAIEGINSGLRFCPFRPFPVGAILQEKGGAAISLRQCGGPRRRSAAGKPERGIAQGSRHEV
jgi:hypothetical protein